MENQIFETTAVLGENNVLEHFEIRKSLANIYGNKKEDVLAVKFKISENQNPNEIVDLMTPDYWGWFDNEEARFTLIYAKKFLLNMCFPYGMKVCEERNQGKAYRLQIISYE